MWLAWIATGERAEYTRDHCNRLVRFLSKDAQGASVLDGPYSYDVFDRRIGKTGVRAMQPIARRSSRGPFLGRFPCNLGGRQSGSSVTLRNFQIVSQRLRKIHCL
ncbi:MAG: hypothetical protein KatS3mg110_1573 [Pirellulaceae bacterium]|nr:MAG: hypothetical protein KatS3mg110_1573 [Pirellulaceae bacterium]